jgi:hypothetical protein
VRVFPRAGAWAEALGCFLFARRALETRTRKCPNSRPVVLTPGISPLRRRALQGRQKNGDAIQYSTLVTTADRGKDKG